MGDSSTDKSDMPNRGALVKDYQSMYFAEAETNKQLKQSIQVLTDQNAVLRVQLGNLEARQKREVELTTAYRRVIKDLSEDHNG